MASIKEQKAAEVEFQQWFADEDHKVTPLISKEEKRQAAALLLKEAREEFYTVDDLLEDDDFAPAIEAKALVMRDDAAEAERKHKAAAKTRLLAHIEASKKTKVPQIDPAEQARIDALRAEIRERQARRDRMTALRVKYPLLPESFLDNPRMVMALRALLLQKPDQGKGELGVIHRLKIELDQLEGSTHSECYALRGEAMKLATQTTKFLEEFRIFTHADEAELAQCRHEVVHSSLAWIFDSFVEEAPKPQKKAKKKLTPAQQLARKQAKSREAEEVKRAAKKK